MVQTLLLLQEMQYYMHNHTKFDAAILTKSDADARGGAALSIVKVTSTPVLYVGVGQEYKDLKTFDKELFLETVFGKHDESEISITKEKVHETESKIDSKQVEETIPESQAIEEYSRKSQITDEYDEIKPSKDSDPFEGLDTKDINLYADLFDAPPPENDQQAQELKNGKTKPILKNKTLAMIFQKPSTRTRVSFETGMFQLGGHALNLSSNELQLSREESIEDTARTLSRYTDIIMARVYDHKMIEILSKNSTVPVINGLSNSFHPCQTLADLMTIKEKKKKLQGLKIAWIGDGNNVCNSLIYGCSKSGINISIATPKGFEPDRQVIKKAKTNAIFMHCLPAKRGHEVTSSVIDGPQSVVWDQVENRLHTQKALLVSLLGI